MHDPLHRCSRRANSSLNMDLRRRYLCNRLQDRFRPLCSSVDYVPVRCCCKKTGGERKTDDSAVLLGSICVGDSIKFLPLLFPSFMESGSTRVYHSRASRHSPELSVSSLKPRLPFLDVIRLGAANWGGVSLPVPVGLCISLNLIPADNMVCWQDDVAGSTSQNTPGISSFLGPCQDENFLPYVPT